MNPRIAIEQAVWRAFEAREHVRSIAPLSGGCIHHASRVELASGRTIVAKVASGAKQLFDEELRGLGTILATGAIPAPEPIGVAELDGTSVLLMSYVKPAPATPRAWQRLGEDLAALHRADSGKRYGFDADNFLGSTLQPNGWMDDWVEFNRVRRLGHQVALASSKGLLHASEQRELEKLMERLDEFLPRRPKPALLHGDLWSGNALPAVGERIAVIDPAVSIGDGWADIAMMRLFGGFDQATFEAYGEAIDDKEKVEARIAIYQLYHVLNHVNLFGRGYAGQALGIVRGLI